MDQYNSYQDSAAWQGFEQQPRRGGGSFFKVVVILLLVILIALMWLLVRERYSEPLQSVETTPQLEVTPVPTAVPEEPAEEAFQPEPTPQPQGRGEHPAPVLDGVPPEILSDETNPIPDIFEAVSPSVVGVINYVEMPFGKRDILSVYGTGTGFIVSSEGYVLTNAHVIEDAMVVTVRLADGKEIDAEVIGADKETDVAVLRIDANGLKPLACGDSDKARVGEFVLAIGNPLDSDQLANTLTYGILSATAREVNIDSYTNTYLQTDAAINYGNSGGPLLNMKGEVIGINSAKSITAGYDAFGNPVAAEGIGFALPINYVLEIMDLLVEDGVIQRPGVGVTISTVTEIMAEADGIPVGAYVESVVPGSPAETAGLKIGDIIVEANGTAIETHDAIVAIVAESKIGDTLSLKVYRAGETLEITIHIGNKTEMDFDATE